MQIHQSVQTKKPKDEGAGMVATIKQMFATGEFLIFILPLLKFDGQIKDNNFLSWDKEEN